LEGRQKQRNYPRPHEIEEQVLEGIIRIMCRELQTSWNAIALEFNFGQRQQILQTQRLMPPEEKNLCLSFKSKCLKPRHPQPRRPRRRL